MLHMIYDVLHVIPCILYTIHSKLHVICDMLRAIDYIYIYIYIYNSLYIMLYYIHCIQYNM